MKFEIHTDYDEWNAFYYKVSELVPNSNLNDLRKIFHRFTIETMYKGVSTEELIKYAHKMHEDGVWSEDMFNGYVSGVRAKEDE